MTERIDPAIELSIDELAAGGDGVGRDARGRVTFVPRTAPGDRVRVQIVHATKTFARGELVEVVEPGRARIEPPCRHFLHGCGGCTWQHVARETQLAAKQTVVAGALRKLAGLELHPIAAPAPDLGWRRRARFHAAAGTVGLYAVASHRLIPVVERGRDGAKPANAGEWGPLAPIAGAGSHCPQLEAPLDAALAEIAIASPPDGDIALLLGQHGAIAIGVAAPWRAAPRLIGRAGIVGVVAGDDTYGDPVLEIEPGLWTGPWDFAQASRTGNAALIASARAALGPGPGQLLELYAGAGNFTRGFVADGWTVTASDVAAPPRAVLGVRFELGGVANVLGRARVVDAIVLDPPRAGAAEALDGIVRLAPRRLVYVSCDVATLARDAAKLVAAGYRAVEVWPFDLMPQTAHVELVMRFER